MWQVGVAGKGQWHEARPGGVQVLVFRALGVDAVEAADHVAVDGVDHRLGHGVVHPFVGQHPFLDHDLARRQGGQLGEATFGCQRLQVPRVAHHQDAHAAGPLIRLDDHEGLLADAVFLVLAPQLAQQDIDVRAQRLESGRLAQVDGAAVHEHRVDEPGVDADQLAEALAHVFVALVVTALAPHRHARLQRWQQVLLVQVFQDAGCASGQVVVEQDGAGIEVLQAQAVALALHRLERERVAIGQGQGRAALERRVDRAQPHVQPGHAEDFGQPLQVGQVEAAQRPVARHHEQVVRLRADLLDRCLGRLHRQRQGVGRQVVPAVGTQVGAHRRQLEAGVADRHAAIKGRRVLHPLEPEPALDHWRGVEQALLQFVDGALESGDEVGNHGKPVFRRTQCKGKGTASRNQPPPWRPG